MLIFQFITAAMAVDLLINEIDLETAGTGLIAEAAKRKHPVCGADLLCKLRKLPAIQISQFLGC